MLIESKQRSVSFVRNELTTRVDELLAMVEREAKYRTENNWHGMPKKQGKRTALISWLFELADHFDIPRESVQSAVSIMNRFIKKDSTEDGHLLELLVVTSFLISVKVMYQEKLIYFNDIDRKCHNQFEMKDVAKLEAVVLKDLDWMVHEPTPNSFVGVLMDVFFGDQDRQLVSSVYEKALFFSELSAYMTSSYKSSLVAVAAITNALLQSGYSHLILPVIELSQKYDIDTEKVHVVRDLQLKLYNVNN